MGRDQGYRADGSAHDKFDAEFTDSAGVGDFVLPKTLNPKALTNYPSLKKVMFKNKRGYNWTFAQAKTYFEKLPGEEPKYSPELEDALKMRL